MKEFYNSNENFKEYIDKYCKKHKGTIEEALKEAAICFIFTEWQEIKAVKPEEYKNLMRIPLVYDGRNLYKPEEMQEVGIEYYSIGR